MGETWEFERLQMINRWRKQSCKAGESGQAMLFVLLALGLALMGAAAFSVDLGNMWMQRQTAQNVADAACTAAAMDMLTDATSAGTTQGGFTAGTDFSCSGNATAAPCVYAANNMGYAPAALVAGQPGYDVSFTFPTTVPGVVDCTGTPPPPVCTAAGFTPFSTYVRATVANRVPVSFAGLLSGSTTTDVMGQATCGLVFSSAPIPILIMNPSLSGTLDVRGSGSQNKITIYGGPQRSIQVNSTSATAVTVNGGPTVDLSKGGQNLSGSDIGITGGPGTPPFTYLGSPPGKWVDPAPAISDPFASLPVPAKPATNGTITPNVPAGTKGCPAGTSGGCTEYSAGYYPSGIKVKNDTAIFDPGLYYIDGTTNGLTLDANSCVRPSTLAGDGSGGTVFYFNTAKTVTVVADSGSKCAASITTTASSGTGQLQYGVKCTSGSDVPANLPTTITGNLLMGACTGPYGDPLGTDDPIGEQHGIVFFQNRAVNLGGTQPSWGGGGTAAILGSMYFHYCNSDDDKPSGTPPITGLGSKCNPSAFTDQISLQGNPGSESYVVGNIVADELTFGGTPQVYMDLNPNALYYVLKATLLQ